MTVNNGIPSLDVRSLAIDFHNPDAVYSDLAEGAGIFKVTNSGEPCRYPGGRCFRTRTLVDLQSGGDY